MQASDVLSAIFEAAKIRATAFPLERLRDPFEKHVDGALVHQHRVVSGTCRLQVDDTGEALVLEEGDFVLLTRRQSHRLLSVRGARRQGEVTVMSGAFGRSGESADALFALLPPVLHMRAAARSGSGLLVEALGIADHVSSNMASEAISARLAEIIFLMGVRRALAEGQEPPRWASRAFFHPQIGRAIRALHDQPMRKWTAASVAREVAMSRSTFTELFTRLVGEPPLAYLTRLRMQLAADLLRGGGGSLADVAARVGYGSEGAFSKAFKRALGVSPGAYRLATEAARATAASFRVEPRGREAPSDATEHASLQTKLARIAYDLEHLLPPAICAIMRFDRSARVLRHGAAPSLPEDYNRTIDGVRVGPCTGSCGTAVHRRAPVIVRDIGESELWADFRYLAERFHLRSCWSKPIFDDGGEVLGTFAIYYRECHEPSAVELAIADHLAERARPVLADAQGAARATG